MDLLSHISLGLILADLMLRGEGRIAFIIGSVLPDVDSIGNLFEVPLHRTLLHDPFLWLALLFLPLNARYRRYARPLALGALLHVLTDLTFGPVPLYPIPLVVSLNAEVLLNGTQVYWTLGAVTEPPQTYYAGGHVVSQYGVSLFVAWAFLRLARFLDGANLKHRHDGSKDK